MEEREMKLIGRLPYLSILAILLITNATSAAGQSPARAPGTAEGLSATDFARLNRDLSEEGGYFRSDNFTSNETPYLHVVDKLRKLGANGGAYIGVGPEQNFTYIAKVRPRIAFIVDIRRQAMIQHLMYKAVFHLSPNRAQFLSRLLSKPLPSPQKETQKETQKEKATSPNLSQSSSLDELLAYFSDAPGDDQTFATNLAAIRKAIKDDFQVNLSEEDQQSLEYVYKSFRTEGLDIAFRMDGSRGGYFPTLKDLIVQTDLNGKLGNFLTSVDDYDYVRGMHLKNLIIPVVGDFAGKKAIAAVGDYLRKGGFTVTAFYTSNVEQYLFESESFAAFANNVRKLPINDRSLFIRSASGRYSHPARLPGHRSATLLQQITVFLKDFDDGRYQNYFDLIMTNYISAEKQ
jgi:hypothetical protein